MINWQFFPKPKKLPDYHLDDVVLSRIVKEAGMFYKMELNRKTSK